MNVVDFLTSEEAQSVMRSMSDHAFDPIRDVPQLRRRFDRDQAAAIAGMLGVRRLAHQKFGERAAGMVYTDSAVQQATPWQVAERRSRRFDADLVCADLGCGIGGDAMWLASTVVGVDIDRERLDMARHNATLTGVTLHPVRADLETLPALGVEQVFADPARRDASGRRIFDVERYRPPLGLLLERWRPAARGLAVKLHPGVDFAALPGDGEVEFVSLDGDLKEACLWLGDFSAHTGTTATVLPAGVSVSGRPLEVAPEVGEVDAWLFEPDPAVIRSGLVGDVAATLGLHAIDRTIAYLTGRRPLESPLVTCYEVRDLLPFHGKKIRARLREMDVGAVEVKKRGSAVDPEAFRRSLDLSGDRSCVIFLTRARGKQVAIIAARG